MPPKFFITHSWKDIEFARRLFKDLKAQGVEGWMDDTTVRGGQRLAEEINRGLEGCDVYLPIMSPAALESPWCWEEINAAISLSNRRGRDRKLTIIPIIADWKRFTWKRRLCRTIRMPQPNYRETAQQFTRV